MAASGGSFHSLAPAGGHRSRRRREGHRRGRERRIVRVGAQVAGPNALHSRSGLRQAVGEERSRRDHWGVAGWEVCRSPAEEAVHREDTGCERGVRVSDRRAAGPVAGRRIDPVVVAGSCNGLVEVEEALHLGSTGPAAVVL